MMGSRLIFLRCLVDVELRDDGESYAGQIVVVLVQSRRGAGYD